MAAADVGAVLAKVMGGGAGDSDDTPLTDPYASTPENFGKVNALIDKFLKINSASRTTFEWGWFRNLALIAGAHDIVRLRGQVRTRPMPSWYPRVQTNKFREKYTDLLSALCQGKVPIKYLPKTDDDAAHATAEIGERVREVIYAETGLEDMESEIAEWFISTGNVFVIPYYDFDEKYGTTPVPKMACGQCQGTFSAGELPEAGEDTETQMCPTCDEAGVGPSPLAPHPTETDDVPIGSITQILSSVPYTLQVTNPAPAVGGTDAETPAQTLARLKPAAGARSRTSRTSAPIASSRQVKPSAAMMQA